MPHKITFLIQISLKQLCSETPIISESIDASQNLYLKKVI